MINNYRLNSCDDYFCKFDEKCCCLFIGRNLMWLTTRWWCMTCWTAGAMKVTSCTVKSIWLMFDHICRNVQNLSLQSSIALVLPAALHYTLVYWHHTLFLLRNYTVKITENKDPGLEYDTWLTLFWHTIEISKLCCRSCFDTLREQLDL